MKLYLTNEVPELSTLITCRQKRAGLTIRSLFAILCLSILTIGLWQLDWTWIAGFTFLIMMLVVPFLIRIIVAVHRSSNWVIKVVPEGVWINFRSYLHYRIANAETVVWIENHEITQAYLQTQVKIHNGPGELPKQDYVNFETGFGEVTVPIGSSDKEVVLTSLKIQLKNEENMELEKAIQEEQNSYEEKKLLFVLRGFKNRIRRPVLFLKSDGTLEIPWRDPRTPNSNNFSPKLNAVLKQLSSQISIGEPVHLPRKTCEENADYKTQLEQLIEEGKMLTAIQLARKVNGYSLVEAKETVEALQIKLESE